MTVNRHLGQGYLTKIISEIFLHLAYTHSVLYYSSFCFDFCVDSSEHWNTTNNFVDTYSATGYSWTTADVDHTAVGTADITTTTHTAGTTATKTARSTTTKTYTTAVTAATETFTASATSNPPTGNRFTSVCVCVCVYLHGWMHAHKLISFIKHLFTCIMLYMDYNFYFFSTHRTYSIIQNYGAHLITTTTGATATITAYINDDHGVDNHNNLNHNISFY